MPAKLPSAGLHTLFVGISPAPKSAQTNHFFAAPSNSFWKMMYHGGVWHELKGAAADDDMVKAGFGFIDMSPRATSASSNLDPSDFSGSKMRLRGIASEHRVRTVAFVGKQAAEKFSGVRSRELAYGPQEFPVGDSPAYLLPSTGGNSVGIMGYQERLGHYRKFATFIQPYWRRQAPSLAP